MTYRPPQGDGWQQLADRLADLEQAVRTLQRPTGTSTGSLVAQVQAALANINATVATAIAANSYDKNTIDNKDAATLASANAAAQAFVQAGFTTTGSITSGGQLTSAQPLKSVGSYNYQVTTNYKTAWINQDGQVGFSPSTLASKKDLEPFPADLAAAFLALTPYLGRYVWDDDDAPLKVFFIAEDAHAAGFGPDVVPLDEDGNPEAINYSQLVVPLLAAMQQQQAQIEALSAAVVALGGTPTA